VYWPHLDHGPLQAALGLLQAEEVPIDVTDATRLHQRNVVTTSQQALQQKRQQVLGCQVSTESSLLPILLECLR
jgi:hypothetical protein